MTLTEQAITIAMCVLGTTLTRFLPFVIFGGKKPTPYFVHYLGRMLPSAVFGMLIIYCLKDVNFAGSFHGAPELLAISATIALHFLRRQMLLSIAGGTIVYMFLVQYIFNI